MAHNEEVEKLAKKLMSSFNFLSRERALKQAKDMIVAKEKHKEAFNYYDSYYRTK